MPRERMGPPPRTSLSMRITASWSESWSTEYKVVARATPAGPPLELFASNHIDAPGLSNHRIHVARNVVPTCRQASAVLEAVQDASRRRSRCRKSGILDSSCARRSAGGRSGRRDGRLRSNKGMDPGKEREERKGEDREVFA